MSMNQSFLNRQPGFKANRARGRTHAELVFTPLGHGASENGGTVPNSTYTVLVLRGVRTRLGAVPGASIICFDFPQGTAEQKKVLDGPAQKIGALALHGSVTSSCVRGGQGPRGVCGFGIRRRRLRAERAMLRWVCRVEA